MKQASQRVIYFVSTGVDPICRLLVLPWAFRHVFTSSYVSLCPSVTYFAYFCAAANFGHFLARNQIVTVIKTPSRLSITVLLLVLCLTSMIFGLTTRFSMLCACHFVFGLIRGNALHPAIAASPSTLATNSSVNNFSRSAISIVTLLFVPLLSSLTYSTSMHSVAPAFMPCYLLSLLCLACIAHELISGRVKSTKKYAGVEYTSLPTTVVASKPKITITAEQCCNPPQEFLDMCSNRLAAAQQAYRDALQWRVDNGIDDILSTPQNHFAEIIKYYPHFIQGRSREGCHVCYELLGKAKPRELTKLGITPAQLLMHFVLRNEFIFQRCIRDATDGMMSDAKSSGEGKVKQLMTILDVGGIGFSDLNQDVISFIILSSEVMDKYYPGRVKRLVICNAPSWFNMVWSQVAKVLPESVRKKIVFVAKVADLDEFIDPRMRPPQYGGTGCEGGQSTDHKGLLAVADSWSKIAVQLPPPVKTEVPVAKDAGWMSRIVPKSPAAKAPKPKAKNAYLGDSNSFRYDKASGQWILDDGDQGPSDTVAVTESLSQSAIAAAKGKESKGNSSLAEVEEHGLVLAIQAAHEAKLLLNKKLPAGGSMSGNDPMLRKASQLISTKTSEYHQVHRTMSGSQAKQSLASVSHEKTGFHDEDKVVRRHRAPVSADLFLIVLVLYFVAVVLVEIVFTLLPVWFMLPHTKGGLGYTVKDVGMLLSCAGAVLLLLHQAFAARILSLSNLSPARMLRVASVIVTIACVLLAWLLGSGVDEDGKEAWITALLPQYQPSYRWIALVIPSALLALLVGSAIVVRKCSSALLQISLQASALSSHDIIAKYTFGAGTILGPLLAAGVFNTTYKLHLPYPMNAAFFLHLIACTCCLLFLTSLFIGIQFWGEFGLISDEMPHLSATVDVHSTIVSTLSDMYAFCSNRTFEKEGSADVRGSHFETKAA